MVPFRVLAAAAALMLSSAAVAAPATERLTIETASGRHGFDVEVMHKGPELQKGLMFRKSMAADHGMLFDFGKSQDVSMWMKNTYLPLDMVFIDRSGKVVNVAHDTVPMSEAIIPSQGAVLGVLEINAGVAKSIGLKAGDAVKASIFHQP